MFVFPLYALFGAMETYYAQHFSKTSCPVFERRQFVLEFVIHQHTVYAKFYALQFKNETNIYFIFS